MHATVSTIFYDIYSEAQKRDEPARAHTGLFFFRGRPGRPLRRCCAGRRLLLCRLRSRGLSARRGNQQERLQCVRSEIPGGIWRNRCHAGSRRCHLLCFPQRGSAWCQHRHVFVWGSSAGARMVAAIGTSGSRLWRGRPTTARGHRHGLHGHQTTRPADPPTFVVVGENDGIAPPDHDGKARCGAPASRRRG